MSKVGNMQAALRQAERHARELGIFDVEEKPLPQLRDAIRKKVHRGEPRIPRTYFATVAIDAIQGFTPIYAKPLVAGVVDEGMREVIGRRPWSQDHGILTIAARYAPAFIGGDAIWLVGWAWASPADSYSPKRGRIEASKRLSIPVNVSHDGAPPLERILRKVAAEILDGRISVPTWAQPHDSGCSRHTWVVSVVRAIIDNSSHFHG